jgi:hypothetical protein
LTSEQKERLSRVLGCIDAWLHERKPNPRPLMDLVASLTNNGIAGFARLCLPRLRSEALEIPGSRHFPEFAGRLTAAEASAMLARLPEACGELQARFYGEPVPSRWHKPVVVQSLAEVLFGTEFPGQQHNPAWALALVAIQNRVMAPGAQQASRGQQGD